MATIGTLTNLGLLKCQDAQSNEGWKIFPTDFGVSTTKGAFDPTRTAPNVDQWFKAPISGKSSIDEHTQEMICRIPSGQSVDVKKIEEVCIYARDSLNVEFLLAIYHPDVDSVQYNPDGSVSLRYQIAITNVVLEELFDWKYTQAGEISAHNLDPVAHPEFRRRLDDLVDFDDYLKQRLGIRLKGGGVVDYLNSTLDWSNDFEILLPFYGKTTLPAGSIGSLVEDDILYSYIYTSHRFIADGDGTGIVKLDDVTDFSNDDYLIIGDQDSVKIAGRVYGAPSAGGNETQKISFDAVPDEGTWKVSFLGAETGLLTYNITANALKSRLEDLTTIDLVDVSGNFTSGFTIEFKGVNQKTNVSLLTISENTLKKTAVLVNVTPSVLSEGYEGRITVDDGLGSVIDLSAFSTIKGAWVMRTNSALVKGKINTAPLKPDTAGHLDGRIYIVGVVAAQSVYLFDGREITRTWVYEEPKRVTSPYNPGDLITIPLDSRNSDALKNYRNGRAELQVLKNGVEAERAEIPIAGAFTPSGYSTGTGLLSFLDGANLSEVRATYTYKDASDEKHYIIGGVSNTPGSKGFLIATGLTPGVDLDISGDGNVVDQDFEEDGAENDYVNKIRTRKIVPVGAILKFVIAPSIKQVAGVGPGGSIGSLQSAYDGGRVITIASGEPIEINGPGGEKLMKINGDFEIAGLLDPTGVIMSRQSSNPITAGKDGIWISDDGEMNYTTADAPDSAIRISPYRRLLNGSGGEMKKGRLIRKISGTAISYADWTTQIKASVIGIIRETKEHGVLTPFQTNGFVPAGVIEDDDFIEGSVPSDNTWVYLGAELGKLTISPPSGGSGFWQMFAGFWENGGLNMNISPWGIA